MAGGVWVIFSSLYLSYFFKLSTISRYNTRNRAWCSVQGTDFEARLPGSNPGSSTSCGDIKQIT